MKSRERKRKRCLKCGQELSHSAYIRHQNPVVCPPVDQSQLSTTTTNEKRIAVEIQHTSPTEQDFDSIDVGTYHGVEEGERLSSTERMIGSASSSDVSTESEGEAEVIVSDEEVMSLTECSASSDSSNPMQADHSMPEVDKSEQLYIKKIVTHMCLFITFFQLCYGISEHGISLLLAFLKSLFSWIYSLCPQSDNLKLLKETMPPNVYFLRKLVGSESDIILYVSCPKRNSIYKYEDCVKTYHNGRTESLTCPYIEYSEHPQVSRRVKCDALLLRSLRHGNNLKLIPRKIYPYMSVLPSLTKLCNQPDFLHKCEQWRSRENSSDMLTDVYDGRVWKAFQVVENRPFLQLPNNLCLKLNLDWFNPFEHIQYSVGVFYLVIENLPRSERYKLENVIIIGSIPGPREPKKSVNTYLKPLVDELLVLWQGTVLKATSLFGVVPIRCALTCITCDLPATRKICGFTSFSSLHGCSKCNKEFPCAQFGSKPDYSGYNRDEWTSRTHRQHLQQVSEVMAANTATKKEQLEKKYGVRYSELLRLPYFDIIEYHVIDPMHNLLLGTAKHMISLWKELGLLKNDNLSIIQEKVDQMKIPTKLGRIPYKISSNFSSFTADQWKNWMFIYSLYTLHGVLPMEHYTCWNLFVDACHSLLQPSITICDLNRADRKLVEFATAFEMLYGKDHTTPNMHLHLHIKDSILNFGPVYAFWCFSFERFNGILGSFQKNWMSPELQMVKKFLTYQHLLLSGIPSSMPQELRDFNSVYIKNALLVRVQ